VQDGGKLIVDKALQESGKRAKRVWAEAEEATRRADASVHRAAVAQREAVRRLEHRSSQLDGWEREIEHRRDMPKLQRMREPFLWTELDIFLGRLAILSDAHKGGVFHLLFASRVFTAPSSVFCSIFNPQARSQRRGFASDKSIRVSFGDKPSMGG
jgi:hypothetical protein